jgi:phage-related protein
VNWLIDYYSEKVRLDVETLPVGIRASYARLTGLLVEFGLSLRMPHSKSMGDGLFELRPRGSEGIARVMYCTKIGRRIVILHVFIKKTQKTPKRELEIARRRQREVARDE